MTKIRSVRNLAKFNLYHFLTTIVFHELCIILRSLNLLLHIIYGRCIPISSQGDNQVCCIALYCSRRSRIFLRRRPLSCEVPSRRDSVGGGGSSRIFPWSQKKNDAIQWGGVVADRTKDLWYPLVPWIFRLWGPFFFWAFPKGGGPGPPGPPLNRPLYCIGLVSFEITQCTQT